MSTSKQVWQNTPGGVLTLPVMTLKVLDLNIVTACSKKQWLLEVKLTIKN